MALMDMVDSFAQANQVSTEIALDILKEVIMTAYKRKVGKQYENLRIYVDADLIVEQLRTVTDPDKLEDPVLQISPEEAAPYSSTEVAIGDTVAVRLEASTFTRQMAQIAKQVLTQRVHEIQKDLIYHEYSKKIGQLFLGRVNSRTDSDRGGYYISLEQKDVEGFLPFRESIPEEPLESGQTVKVMLKEVKEIARKGESQLVFSRANEDFVRVLMKLNIPEIADGTFIIRAVARKPGEVTKMVLQSTVDLIDPVSVTVGKAGVRIRAIRAELNNERIEIVKWNSDPRLLLANAVQASRVLKNRIAEVFNVELNSESEYATIVVPDEFLAPLIGKKGSHQRMLERICGWRIRFVPYSEFETELQKKQQYVDHILGLSDQSSFEVVDGEGISIFDLPFSEEQLQMLQSAGFTQVEHIIEHSVEDFSRLCSISLDSAMQIWQVVESNVEIEEEE